MSKTVFEMSWYLSVSCKHPRQPPGAPLSTRAPKIWQKSNENWPSLLEDAASHLEPDCIIPDSEGQQLLEVEELKPPAWMGNITTIEKLRNLPEIHEMTVKPQLNSRDIMHSWIVGWSVVKRPCLSGNGKAFIYANPRMWSYTPSRSRVLFQILVRGRWI